MTVSSTTNTNSYTTVNATTHSFAYGFKIFADADLEVIVRSAAGAETVKTLNTHFVVTNAGVDTGGNVLFKFNTGTSSDAHFSSTDRRPASGETVLLRRSLSLTQGTDYIENDSFSSNSHENALDRLTFITQSLGEELNRSFKVSKTNTIASAEFADSAATRASKTLGFDSDGNLTTVADFLPIGGDAAQFTYSTTTTDADPGSGFIRFNNTTLSSASIAYVDDNEINGTDVSAWVLSFDDVSTSASNRGRIRMSKSNTLDTWAVYKISGASTDASGYVKLALTYIDSAGTFANNDKVFLSFVATGAGETGATGATGASGASAADNITLGDAAVSIATSAGNITIDAQGSDTDIIFKGTDGSSDITPLTLDMSDAGKAIFTGAATIAGLATVGGTLGVTGITTLANNLIIPNGGNIGSVGDTDAIAIASNGVVTFSQTPVGGGGSLVKLFQSTWTSAVSQVLMNSVISATYDHYKIVGSVEVSANSICALYMTSGGGSPQDATNTAVYLGEGANRAAATAYVGAGQNGNYTYATFPNNNNIYGNGVISFQMELHDMFTGIVKGTTNVAAARERHFSYNCSEQNVASSDNFQHWGGGRYWNANASHMPQVTGLKFAPTSGNFTEGNIAIYGYVK